MKKILLALALTGVATTASADSWLYAGANVGQSDLDGKNATAAGFHVGTGILPIIGLEAGYNNHGKINDLDMSSYYFAVKPSIDLGPLHVYGKAGVHSYKGEQSGAKNQDGTDAMYGVGVEYFMFDILSVGGSYQNFKTDAGNIGSFNLTATVHFL
ncbi:outer membrane beta-barrel protein [Vibrio tapetis subsp. quintayensis]|uniref:outer membrane beta-barrel protein n=1 Tax=Vibrio tapetis TaxID=52443 RepID=UPI0025B32CF6|nr:outer membrane beta-barrel protein [Vibrio tapetis]MDN3682551.1 outer membrane beta-barrel protein [Vibrio tapetis subsp. quintayensis]